MRDARFSLGELFETKLPVVAETKDPEEGEALVTFLLSITGIVFVDVAYVSFSEEIPHRMEA